MNIRHAALLLPLLACGDPEGTPLEQTAGPDTLELHAADTIGILMGDSNYVFGTIADAVELDGGNIAVLDEAAGYARIFDPDGEFITQVSNRGSGPGELLHPGGMVRLSDNSIAVLDHASGLQRFSAEGDFLEFRTDFQGQDVPQWAWGVNHMGYTGAITSAEPVDDQLMIHFIIARWDSLPEHSVEYFRSSFPYNPERMDLFLKNSFFSASFAASPDGMVAVAPTSTEEYRINLFNPDGSSFGSIRRDMPRVEKTEEEIEEETAMITAILKERGIPEESIMYEAEPFRWMIQPQGLGMDSEGRIWARNGGEDDVIMDVYDGSGEHLAVVRFHDLSSDESPDYLNIKVQQSRILVYSLQDPDYPKLYLFDMPDF